jgi:hypothetical protein
MTIESGVGQLKFVSFLRHSSHKFIHLLYCTHIYVERLLNLKKVLELNARLRLAGRCA